MKIGIVTFWEGKDNYGQTLQAYALQRFLRDKGHDAFIIKYRKTNRRTLGWWLSVPYKVLRLFYKRFFNPSDYELGKKFKRMSAMTAKENDVHPRHFETFKNQYIHFSESVYDQRSIYKNPPQADVYVAGSDQIWRGLDGVFYLQFAPKGRKCIAYAPSFGGLTFDAKDKRILKKYLERFSVLGMREYKGVELCKSVGRNDAFLVMDPTLLLSKDNYIKILPPFKSDSDYLFLYLLGNDMALDVSAVYTWAERYGVSVKYVASQGQQDEYDKLYPNVDEWLGLLNGAKYVVTNSFHGTVFCLIMNKQFCTIPLTGAFARMNGRIVDLLSNLELANRMYSTSLDVLSLPIDYVKVNQKLQMEREKINCDFDMWLRKN